MMRTRVAISAIAVSLCANLCGHAGEPVGDAFTYQGQLRQNGVPANGTFDFRFALTDVNGSTQAVHCAEDVPVVQGLFIAQVDFAAGGGPAFGNEARELAVFVRPANVTGDCALGVNYTPLAPRQPITAAPYAATALHLNLPFNGSSAHAGTSFKIDYSSEDPGTAILGDATNLNGLFVVGVHGRASGIQGTGVLGETTNAPGASCGALPESVGVHGKAVGDCTIGVLGSADDTGGWFSGRTGLKVTGDLVAILASTATGHAISAQCASDCYAGRFTGRVRIVQFGTVRPETIALLQVVTNSANTTDNTAIFQAPNIGPNNSHVHWGTAGDWYIRSAANTGKVVLQDTGGNVGIGTPTPQKKVSVSGGMNLDQDGLQNGTLAASALTFGSNSQEGISSKRTAGGNQFGLDFYTQSFAIGPRMSITQGGNVGIGTTAPGMSLEVTKPSYYGLPAMGASSGDGYAYLHVTSSAGDHSVIWNDGSDMRFGTETSRAAGYSEIMRIDSLNQGAVNIGNGKIILNTGSPQMTLNDSLVNGVYIRFQRSGISIGSIDHAGDTVNYNGFTGAHLAWTDESIESASLVRLTGRNFRATDDPESEPVYGIAKTSFPNDARCLGAYRGPDPGGSVYHGKQVHLVAAVGNGELCVVDTGTDIATGDRLISSDVSGCAMRDDPVRFPIGYVVGRAAEDVHWEDVPGGPGPQRKRKVISVLFENFVRHGDSVNLASIVRAQQTTIDSLGERLAQLEQRLASIEAATRNRVFMKTGD